jgi:energy-dependent translational throttle protein EttA
MASYQYVYVMKGLSKVFPGGKKILDDVWLSFLPGAKIGVLGLNGAGKSTLLKIMAGLDKDVAGENFVAEGATVGYLQQEPQLDPKKTVYENVLEGLGPIKGMVDRFNEVSNLLGEVTDDDEMNALLAEQAELQEKIDAADAGSSSAPSTSRWTRCAARRRRRRHQALGRRAPPRGAVPPAAAEARPAAARRADQPSRRRVRRLARALPARIHRHRRGGDPRPLLPRQRRRLDPRARSRKGIPWEGNYSSWLEQKKKRLSLEEKTESKRQKTLERELEWIQASPKARQAKSKARITAYENLLAESKDKAPEEMSIAIPPGPRLGNVVVEAEGLSKGFGDNLLIDGLNFKLPPGGIVGVIGPNGAGKTTLFRMITGQEKPDGGVMRIGETVKIGYVDQSRDTLDANKSVWEEITGGGADVEIGGRKMPSRAYVAQFNFSGNDQQKKVGILSGGERNRVHLAKILKTGCNLLLLDEPTNDLDVDTLRALEEGLSSFPGCAVIISHDRWFLDRIATHILAFEGDSQVVWFEGNYQDYEADKKRRLGADADQPHRIKYKKLTH